eukprot:TRINITY_DN8731_c0_g1_i1.p1 TRINITY_DN8731_c0_g1~~TRINITY_DN8731_c0_g1_i1.p1  ORF type:complete len:831 (-),score=198.55 TRINITY_DN8731_c0_g1_i1:33-2465(-)
MSEQEQQLRLFASPSFDVAAYVDMRFQRRNDLQMQTHREELKDLRQQAAEELQTNVYKHYREFIGISKDISQMANDMMALHALLTQLGSDITALHGTKLDLEAYTNLAGPETSTAKDTVQDAIAGLQIVEIDVALAERNFEEAATLLDRARKVQRRDFPTQEAHDMIKARATEVIETLTEALQSTTLKSSEITRLIGYLLRLGKPQYAGDVFLKGRSRAIQSELKKLRFQGDTALYVGELSQIVSSAICAAATEFTKLFREHKAMTSSLTMWALAELDLFIDTFRRQVFQADSENFHVMAECMQVAKQNVARLEEAQLGLTFRVDEQLEPYLRSAIKSYYQRITREVLRRVASETWHAFDFVVVDKQSTVPPTVRITDSGKHVYTFTQQFLTNIAPVVSPALYILTVKGMEKLISSYFKSLVLTANANRNSFDDRQNVSILATAFALVDDLIPRTSRAFQRLFNRIAPELEALQQRISETVVELRNAFCAARATQQMVEVLNFKSCDYSQDTIDLQHAAPTLSLQRALTYLGRLKITVEQVVGERDNQVRPILERLLGEMALTLQQDPDFWDKPRDRPMFGHGGLQQFVLDIRYFLAAAADYAPPDVRSLLNDTIAHAVKVYCAAAKAGVRNVLQPDDWFTQRVDIAIENSSDLDGRRISVASMPSTISRPTSHAATNPHTSVQSVGTFAATPASAYTPSSQTGSTISARTPAAVTPASPATVRTTTTTAAQPLATAEKRPVSVSSDVPYPYPASVSKPASVQPASTATTAKPAATSAAPTTTVPKPAPVVSKPPPAPEPVVTSLDDETF